MHARVRQLAPPPMDVHGGMSGGTAPEKALKRADNPDEPQGPRRPGDCNVSRLRDGVSAWQPVETLAGVSSSAPAVQTPDAPRLSRPSRTSRFTQAEFCTGMRWLSVMQEYMRGMSSSSCANPKMVVNNCNDPYRAGSIVCSDNVTDSTTLCEDRGSLRSTPFAGGGASMPGRAALLRGHAHVAARRLRPRSRIFALGEGAMSDKSRVMNKHIASDQIHLQCPTAWSGSRTTAGSSARKGHWEDPSDSGET
jgi:hypothetical protein